MLTAKQVGELKSILEARHRTLREEIREELLASDEEHFIDLAGQVHDLEEESVADLLVDLGLAIIDMHINEIRDIEAALRRINVGAFGICIECDDEMELARLLAYPTRQALSALPGKLRTEPRRQQNVHYVSGGRCGHQPPRDGGVSGSPASRSGTAG